jgi:hypothetical protein
MLQRRHSTTDTQALTDARVQAFAYWHTRSHWQTCARKNILTHAVTDRRARAKVCWHTQSLTDMGAQKYTDAHAVTGRCARASTYVLNTQALTDVRAQAFTYWRTRSHWLIEVEVEVEVTLRPTVSRPVRIGVLHLLEQVTRCYIYMSDNYFLYFSCRAPSLTRGRVCNLQCNDAISFKLHCDRRSVGQFVLLPGPPMWPITRF